MSIEALDHSAILCPLDEFGLIRFSGEDSLPFLQGQLSSDVRAIAQDTAQYSSYSSAKGRMLASLLILRDGDDYLLQLSADIQPAIQKRLSMYVLRSKTKASDVGAELALFGIAGPLAAEKIQSALHVQTGAAMTVQQGDGFQLLSLGADRFELIVPQIHANAITHRLIEAGCTAGDANAWRLAEIRAGIAWITHATQEAFVAQMANLDLTGAVSFNKGCYTGQEIIARTQYLGKLKRRMYRARINAETVCAGQPVFSAEMHGQASGQIVLCAPISTGQWEVLVIAQMSSLEHGLHLASPEGPILEILNLPYEIE